MSTGLFSTVRSLHIQACGIAFWALRKSLWCVKPCVSFSSVLEDIVQHVEILHKSYCSFIADSFNMYFLNPAICHAIAQYLCQYNKKYFPF